MADPSPGGIHISGRFSFAGKRLFDHLDITLRPNAWNCLVGTSGVGKSTLLRLIAGLHTGGQFEGSIRDQNGVAISPRVAYMAQSDLLFPWLSVRQNISLGSRLRRQPENAEMLDELLSRTGLLDHADKKPPQLSGGMRQRTALARTLMEDTDVVLLDEPFSALDAGTRHEMQTLTYSMLQGKTVLLVTHDPAEAVRMSDYLYQMTHEGLVAHELPATSPVRTIDDPEVLRCQAGLLRALS